MNIGSHPLAGLPQGGVQRVAFIGTPEMAVPTLRALVAAGFDVANVITRADKRRSRGNALHPSPVKVAALELGLRVSHSVADLLPIHRTKPLDVGIVVAYGMLIKPEILQQIPMLNLHVSLLPRWRGAAPIERALLAGDDETGVCLMQVVEDLDTGGILAQAKMAIGMTTTVEDIRRQLMTDGTALLLDQLKNGLARAVPQSGVATYAAKIESAELCIDWSQSALQISRVIRLGAAWTIFRGQRLKILDAQIVESVEAQIGAVVVDKNVLRVGSSTNALRLLVVQPQGKASMDAISWVNGARPRTGEKFTDG